MKFHHQGEKVIDLVYSWCKYACLITYWEPQMMPQNIAVILRQLCYGKISFVAVSVPGRRCRQSWGCPLWTWPSWRRWGLRCRWPFRSSDQSCQSPSSWTGLFLRNFRIGSFPCTGSDDSTVSAVIKRFKRSKAIDAVNQDNWSLSIQSRFEGFVIVS